MKRSIRLSLLFISLILFLAITPFVVLYAVGYRLSPLDGAASPVGVLILETIPRRADVFIENTFIGRTPRAVPNIPPGTAGVSLRKEGYLNWEKQVPITATLTTELRNIRLFPVAPARQTLHVSTRLFALSPQERFIAVLEKNNTVVVINSAGEVIIPAQKLAFIPQEFQWSPDSSAVLIVGTKRSAFLNITQTPTALVDIIPVTATNFIGWDADEPGRILYETPKHGIQVYSLATQTSASFQTLKLPVVTSDSVIGISPSGALQQYNFNGELQETLLANVPASTKRLLISSANAIALVSDQGELSLLEEGQLTQVVGHVLEALWSPDGTVLALQTAPNELYLYNASNDYLAYAPLHAKNLILRLSRPLSQFAWYAGSHHLLYQTEDEVAITEVDTRDHAMQYKVDTTNTGKALSTATGDGKFVYYLKQTGATTSLTSVDLLPE